MDLLRFFKQAKYIKELENIVVKHEVNFRNEKWLRTNIQKDRDKISIELENLKRELSELKKTPPEPKYVSNIDISDPIFQKMIKAGRNAIVKKAHPDHGGSREEFEKVEKAFEMLKGLKIQPQEKLQGIYSGLGNFTSQAEQARRQYEGLRAQQPYNQWPYNY